MLTADIRINGALIGHLYILNVGLREDDKTGYKIEYYEPGNEIKRGFVLHDRQEGASVLVQKALEVVNGA